MNTTPGDAETLVTLFERTANEHPGRPAVTDESDSLTYTELSTRSDDLACALSEHGVRPGDRVAIFQPRGVDVFVAILGVLKARGAYVAVDPRYPRARRDLMIRGSGAVTVLTQPGARTDLPADLDVLQWSGGPGAVRRPAMPAAPLANDLACVLFTSGSSGVPKAIMLEHRGLVRFARNPSLVALRPSDRFGQVSSLSFDAFHIEMWCSFAHGAEVVVLPAMPELVSNGMGGELVRRGITAMLVPTMAVNHLAYEDPGSLAPLRILYTGGDVLAPGAAHALATADPRREFHNLYGPTEATTACTAYRVEARGTGPESVPIGRELDGATVHLLDGALRAVPLGAVGELHIGGTGVARGYLGQPALTAERFRPDPWGPAGSRMYATGDLGLRRADGAIEFRGRADDQVKIRGYRVEPREVERTILRHPGVRDAAVFVVGSDHDRRLVAVVVPEDVLTTGSVAEFAAASLPEYLVPSLILTAAEIPGNHHGKRDMARLLQMVAGHRDGRGQPGEPDAPGEPGATDEGRAGDEVDRSLSAIWRDVLGVDHTRPSDDFVALGGNSMLAFRAALRVKRELGVQVEVDEIFRAASLVGITHLVRLRRSAVADAPT